MLTWIKESMQQVFFTFHRLVFSSIYLCVMAPWYWVSMLIKILWFLLCKVISWWQFWSYLICLTDIIWGNLSTIGVTHREIEWKTTMNNHFLLLGFSDCFSCLKYFFLIFLVFSTHVVSLIFLFIFPQIFVYWETGLVICFPHLSREQPCFLL